jgi:hypothetical protein
MSFRVPRSRLGATALGALACAVGLGACGGGFDSAASGEHLIKDYVKKFGQGRVAVKSIKCPGGVAEKVGATYDCKVVLRDTAAGVDHSGTITIHMQKGNKVEIDGTRDIRLQ